MSPQGQFLISGEDKTDEDAIKSLVRGLRPDLQHSWQRFRVAPTLVKGMKPENARTRNSKILAEIKAANVRLRVVATFLHEDADAIEPAHVDVINKKEAPLSTAPGEVIAVVPAWEIETWWLMFPKAAKKVVSAWKTPTKYKNRPVGGVRHSKEELRVLLRQGLPSHPPVPEYKESHSPHFANAIVGNGLLDSPESSSASWNVFVGRVMAL